MFSSTASSRMAAAAAVSGRIAYRLAVVMVMMVTVSVIVSMIVSMIVPVIVAVAVRMIVTMQMCLALRQPRVLAEHQRFDGHRHGHRGQADAPEINVVEIPQHHAVDAQDLAVHVELLA